MKKFYYKYVLKYKYLYEKLLNIINIKLIYQKYINNFLIF